MDLQTVQDKIEIAELIYRYARAVDTKNWELLTTVFTEDAHLDYSAVGYPAGSRDQVLTLLTQALGQVPLTQHFVTNVEVELDGDTANVRAMFYNPMQLPGAAAMTYCGGNYHHEVVRTADGWKSARLTEENLWFSNHPAKSPA
ncbi:nuclear transport factor 2 family protein [Rhodococcus globerulus]|uniref:nuclear transport factor 2 family protein n=1 Tax=Rhodococcus globerulus TaxID=33008 RepID=UPI000AA6EF0A|nr:nuclear transport factor 2 family protein [Rhodococcus globerulus]